MGAHACKNRKKIKMHGARRSLKRDSTKNALDSTRSPLGFHQDSTRIPPVRALLSNVLLSFFVVPFPCEGVEKANSVSGQHTGRVTVGD